MPRHDFDRASQTKICSLCEEALPADRFFKVASRPDGFADRCKKCYYLKAEPRPAPVSTGVAAAAKPTKRVVGEDGPAVVKAYTHTDAEIKAIEQKTGTKFVRWDDMGDCFMPVFGEGKKVANKAR